MQQARRAEGDTHVHATSVVTKVNISPDRALVPPSQDVDAVGTFEVGQVQAQDTWESSRVLRTQGRWAVVFLYTVSATHRCCRAANRPCPVPTGPPCRGRARLIRRARPAKTSHKQRRLARLVPHASIARPVPPPGHNAFRLDDPAHLARLVPQWRLQQLHRSPSSGRR